MADAFGLSDIAAADMDHWRNDKKTEGKAAQTINHYLTVAKTFCDWLVRERRIPENPLAYPSKLNAKADRRIERHPYTVDELGALLAAAEEAGTIVHGMTGQDHALLYRSAVDTGFRWSESRSLLRASFDFAADPATVTIEVAYAKNGQRDTLPLRPELAADLKARMALFLPNAKAFPGMWKDKGADMIRIDLEVAGVLKRNAKGELITKDEYGRVYDFHGLRHTFAPLLNQARVPLATAQKPMRHSDPKLTANIYTHVLVEGKAEALAKLPTITAKENNKEAAAATGTLDDDNGPWKTGMDTETDTQVLAKLQAMTAEENNKEAVVPMENRDGGSGLQGEKMDTRTDTHTPNFDGFIRTYKDPRKREKHTLKVIPGNVKAPVP
jgi:integrase